ncbi:hypothetical protein MesoLj131c_45530 [Mesorhizobium sp. 131-3-5]|uniref:hypothetical protein n=1 Tax=Mesorhizobium sp. 131-3-5 TaxID=2744520 RepID=UPI001927EBD5|nr:hypothetical protein [Mesorhizobium sp. 131-3-5]BCH10295.1 hypothetical protein MesoLj131c_45530 [Mesorhizobium sp. 131-3-5]
MENEQVSTFKDGISYINWDVLRKKRFAQNVEPPRPPDWPDKVTPVSITGLGLIGIDETTNEMFWDGKRLITEKRFTDFERGLAIVGLCIAFIGVGATVVQAWAAVAALP